MASTAQLVEEFLTPLSADSSLTNNPPAVTSNHPSINDEGREEDTKADIKMTPPSQSMPSSDTSVVETSMSPTPNSSLAPFSDSRPPESPDMKFARTRLGHLLSGIRTGEIQTNAQPTRGTRRLSSDLLATKDIMALPAPLDEPMADPIPPPISQIPSPDLDVSNPNALLGDLLPHWKAVKKNWCDYTKIRDRRYEKSIRLLETVYGIQQNVL
ncbi:unnamed protein product [Anisakis simplex]|uniref:Uncharacterized protein n=1 Tax=Anisakis simplex TaxID=6269 RepID=A0A0M3K818_ANISI|nr:unnamed protein product [Anisakis simplex]